jgi:hypothetical protein
MPVYSSLFVNQIRRIGTQKKFGARRLARVLNSVERGSFFTRRLETAGDAVFELSHNLFACFCDARGRCRRHKSIQHTVRYTELAPDRFKNFWR